MNIKQAAEFFELMAHNKFSAAAALLGIEGVAEMPLSEALKTVKARQQELLAAFQAGERADEVKVDLAAWTMSSYEEYTEALRSGDFDKAAELVVSVVKEWPFAGKPSTVSNYAKLSLEDFGSVIIAVNEAVQAIFLQ